MAYIIDTEKRPNGLRGWLAFMGLGVALSPIRNLVEWGNFFTDKDFQFMWESGVPLARGIVLATHGISAAGTAGAFWLCFLFFAKDRRFPLHYTAIHGGIVAAMIAFATWITLATGANAYAEMMPDLGAYAIVAGIWILYLHRSERVANTFVK